MSPQHGTSTSSFPESCASKPAYVFCSPPPSTAVDPSHSHVKTLVMGGDSNSGCTTFYPNSGELMPIENDNFKGVILCRTRTPNDMYFKDGCANRAFEIQIQGYFKRRPIGPSWIGLEITKPLQLSFLKRTMAWGLLKIVSAFGWTFHVSMGDSGHLNDLPILSYPLLSSMDCVIVTPPGGTPPQLGVDFMAQDHPQHFKSLASLPDDFLLDHCYTMCYFSQYLDFESWSFVDVPTFDSLSLHSFWPDASLRFVCYAHPHNDGLHNMHERQTFAEFEIVHQSISRYNEVPSPKHSPIPPIQCPSANDTEYNEVASVDSLSEPGISPESSPLF